MVVGDIIANVVSVPGAGAVNFQPAAGVEIMITYFSVTGGVNTVYCNLWDGVDRPGVTIFQQDQPSESMMKMGITNSDYLRFINDAGGAQPIGYSGVQTK